jgi:hypothetical protein
MAPGQFEVLDEGVANQLFLLPDVHLQPFYNLIRRDGVAEYRQQRCHIQRTAWGQKTQPNAKSHAGLVVRRVRFSNPSRLNSRTLPRKLVGFLLPARASNARHSQSFAHSVRFLCGWFNERQQRVIEFQNDQFVAFLGKLGKKRVSLTDDRRRVLTG